MFEQYRDNFPHLQDKWDEYVGYYKRMEVPAKTILLREGEVSKKAFFIEKGCLRAWLYNKGKDVTFQFFFENEGLSSAESFRRSVPSFLTIETIEPCVLHCISKENLDKIVKETLQIPAMAEQMVDGMFERQLNYMKHFLLSDFEKAWQRDDLAGKLLVIIP